MRKSKSMSTSPARPIEGVCYVRVGSAQQASKEDERLRRIDAPGDHFLEFELTSDRIEIRHDAAMPPAVRAIGRIKTESSGI